MPPEETLLHTDTVRARVMHLDPGASTAWHYHTQVTDHMVCLTGQLSVRLRGPSESLSLSPGERCTVFAHRVHQVANIHPDLPAAYLLLQGVGKYDFNVVEGAG